IGRGRAVAVLNARAPEAVRASVPEAEVIVQAPAAARASVRAPAAAGASVPRVVRARLNSLRAGAAASRDPRSPEATARRRIAATRVAEAAAAVVAVAGVGAAAVAVAVEVAAVAVAVAAAAAAVVDP